MIKLKDLLTEISTKAGLEDVIKGRTSAIEGIKMSHPGFSTSSIQSSYNFVMIANHTTARDFAKYIKYKLINYLNSE